MNSLIQNYNHLIKQVRVLELKYKRIPNSVTILAVSKRHTLESIEALHNATGHLQFGENVVQEAVEKIQTTTLELDWHFIGNIQSNKTALISRHFNFVHSIDRFKIAERLSNQRPPELSKLNVCIEVNLSSEPQKSGVPLINIEELAEELIKLPNLKLRGLMAIPEKTDNFDLQRKTFAKLYQAQDSLINSGFELDVLSMGMSHDFEAAIAEGATMIRVGTGIFGARN